MHDTLERSAVVKEATIHAGAIVQASSDAYRPTESMKPLSVAAPSERGDLVLSNIYQEIADVSMGQAPIKVTSGLISDTYIRQ